MINQFKNKIYAVVFWQTGLGEVANKINDLKLFYKFSFKNQKLETRENFQAFLTKQYHIVEKGLALPNPRKAFGKAKIKLLILKSKQYVNHYGEDRIILNIKETLKVYLNRNPELKISDVKFYNILSEFINIDSSGMGGVKVMKLQDIENAINIDFESFLKTRTSVRNFSNENVNEVEIEKALELARFTPSVCNRQGWLVHYITDRDRKNELLKLQGGSSGFTESINQLLIISVDIRKFTKLESNQIFVDGGMFAMNVLLALHARKIASCCLNLCVPYIVENKIKALAKIPKPERLIMMIGIGKFKDNFEVAMSDRKITNEILVRPVL